MVNKFKRDSKIKYRVINIDNEQKHIPEIELYITLLYINLYITSICNFI